jgi:hypothetical protein
LAEIHGHAPHGLLSDSWPGVEKVEALVQAAGGLFVWAFTAYKFVEGKGYKPQACLELVLKPEVHTKVKKGLDVLCTVALNSALNTLDESHETVLDFQVIVDLILVAQTSLTAEAIDKLLFKYQIQCLDLILHLASVLSFSGI